ncbi:hypothetical protein LCGC14_1745950, partial [marine sediment metagenome]
MVEKKKKPERGVPTKSITIEESKKRLATKGERERKQAEATTSIGAIEKAKARLQEAGLTAPQIRDELKGRGEEIQAGIQPQVTMEQAQAQTQSLEELRQLGSIE